MPFCVEYQCDYTTKKGINKAPRGVTFHRFPTDKKLWSVWVKMVSIKDWKPVLERIIDLVQITLKKTLIRLEHRK